MKSDPLVHFSRQYGPKLGALLSVAHAWLHGSADVAWAFISLLSQISVKKSVIAGRKRRRMLETLILTVKSSTFCTSSPRAVWLLGGNTSGVNPATPAVFMKNHESGPNVPDTDLARANV